MILASAAETGLQSDGVKEAGGLGYSLQQAEVRGRARVFKGNIAEAQHM